MPRNDNPWAQAGRYMSLGMLPPVGALIGYGIGYLLDRQFHTHFLYLIFLLLGTAGGVMALIRDLLADLKNNGS